MFLLIILTFSWEGFGGIDPPSSGLGEPSLNYASSHVVWTKQKNIKITLFYNFLNINMINNNLDAQVSERFNLVIYFE